VKNYKTALHLLKLFRENYWLFFQTRCISRYATSHGLMCSPLGRNALYCRLRYDIGISTMSSLKVTPGKQIWCHHLSSIAPELISKADVLKDMVMLRVIPYYLTKK